MSKLDSYSIRKNIGKSSPLKYDVFPDKLKNQIIHIWRNFLMRNSVTDKLAEIAWKNIHDKLAELHGEKKLFPRGDLLSNFYQIQRVIEYFDKIAEIDYLLDVVEISFSVMKKIEPVMKKSFYNDYQPFEYNIEQAIEDLNDRFSNNQIGYEYKNGRIIKIDNKLLNADIVNSTLKLTDNEVFQNSNDEFISALEHFRFNRYKESITDCLKSFETTLKIVCKENKWEYLEDKDTVSALIDICIKNGLFPKYLLNEFTSLSSLLKSGSATIRNRNSAHGQGVNKKKVPKHLASFMIYLTGATINYIIDSNEAMVSTNKI